MNRVLAVAGALFGLAAVALGAFGAHGLEARVEADRLETWATAAQYLAWHAPALLALAALTGQRTSRLLAAAGFCLIAGTLLFSGSLFLLVLSDISAWGAVTPFGGVTLVVGWGLAAAGLWRGLDRHG